MTTEDLKADIRHMAHWSKMPVIVAVSLKTMVFSGEDAGDDVVIAKPIKLEDLDAAIHETLRRRTVSPPVPRSSPSDHTDAMVVALSECKGRVLVVDDYATNREVASIHLTAAGFQVDAVDNGQQDAESFRRQTVAQEHIAGENQRAVSFRSPGFMTGPFVGSPKPPGKNGRFGGWRRSPW